MAFTYGLAAFIIYPLRFRATAALVLRPTPENILSAVERHRVTSIYCVPTSFHQMLEQVDNFDLGSVRKCASAGENLHTSLWKQWHDRTGIRIVNGIGATEILSHFMAESLAVERIGSTGKAVPGYTIRLIDKEGQPLPRNARGRIAIRGPTGCRYLGNQENQHSFVQDGWNVTGDIFVQDEEGYFWFVDRDDDMIVSAGYNIHPRVERALRSIRWSTTAPSWVSTRRRGKAGAGLRRAHGEIPGVALYSA
jgi:2-aminobenzoate-CoA ligase